MSDEIYVLQKTDFMTNWPTRHIVIKRSASGGFAAFPRTTLRALRPGLRYRFALDVYMHVPPNSGRGSATAWCASCNLL